jgi:hypothetical protein
VIQYNESTVKPLQKLELLSELRNVTKYSAHFAENGQVKMNGLYQTDLTLVETKSKIKLKLNTAGTMATGP